MPPKAPSYTATKLPVLLDLQNRNTREQIETGNSRAPAGGGGVGGGGAGAGAQVAAESKSECERIMAESSREFLGKRGITNGHYLRVRL